MNEVVVFIYNTILAIKMKVSFSATWMDLAIIILSEMSQKEKNKDDVISLTCGIYTVTPVNYATRQKQTPSHREQIRGFQGGWQ